MARSVLYAILNVLSTHVDVMYDLPACLSPDLLRSLIEISCMVFSYLHFGPIRQVYAVRLIDVYFPPYFPLSIVFLTTHTSLKLD